MNESTFAKQTAPSATKMLPMTKPILARLDSFIGQMMIQRFRNAKIQHTLTFNDFLYKRDVLIQRVPQLQEVVMGAFPQLNIPEAPGFHLHEKSTEQERSLYSDRFNALEEVLGVFIKELGLCGWQKEFSCDYHRDQRHQYLTLRDERGVVWSLRFYPNGDVVLEDCGGDTRTTIRSWAAGMRHVKNMLTIEAEEERRVAETRFAILESLNILGT